MTENIDDILMRQQEEAEAREKAGGNGKDDKLAEDLDFSVQ